MKSKIVNYFLIAMGCFIYTVGINIFIVPSGIFSVGIFGLAQEISYVFTRTYDLTSILYFVINIPVLILGWYKVGKKFTLRTLVCVILVSVFQIVIPTDTGIVDDLLLEVITGSILCGFGLALILKQGASTGGTDIISMYFSLIKGKSFGFINIALNLVIIIIAVYINNDFNSAIYMLISLYTIGIVVDKIYNSHEKLTLIVITTKPTEIRDIIFSDIGRGCTILDSYGGQSFSKNNTLLLTISKGELYKTISLLKDTDENSFINVLPVESVVGYFQNHFKKSLEWFQKF